jgi:hypothetical protein
VPSIAPLSRKTLVSHSGVISLIVRGKSMQFSRSHSEQVTSITLREEICRICTYERREYYHYGVNIRLFVRSIRLKRVFTG